MPTPELSAPDPAIPRVLLFGHRGAGKSALIGALLRAGETQGETLRGEVVSSSADLPRIRDAVYSGAKMEPSQHELASYTVRLRPWRVGSRPVGEPLTVILDDCDGKAAESLLTHLEPITQRDPGSPVARAVVETDTIVLLVDAASTSEQLAEAFEEFHEFLTVVGRAKTDARAVGGFPVFLVLTQCDRLARPGDTLPTWEARVNQRSDAAWKAFDAFLKDAAPHDDDPPSQYLPFGSVDLTVAAVAVRKPLLSDSVGPTDTPHGVAELFRDCFAEARAHRDRVRASDTRLKWTARLALAAVGVLLTGLATVALFPPHANGPVLAEKVRDYFAHEPAAAVRLADDAIERNKQALLRFRGDSSYPDLPPDLRALVESHLKEIEDYRDYRAKLAGATAPASARSLPELATIHAALLTTLALPSEYAWGETAAAELRGKWLADCAAIEANERVLVDKYRAYDLAGTALTLRRSFDVSWLNDLASLVATADRPPFPLDDPLPGSPTVNQPRGEAVTYRVPYEFDEVYQARRYWEETRDRVSHLRDLADALGLTTAPNRRAPILVLLEPDGVDSATPPGTLWTDLVRIYPPQSEGYPEWEVRNFPDPRSELAARLQKSFVTGTRHVYKLMNVQDTKQGWKVLAAKLNEPTYRDWGRLLHLLARLQDPSAANPVTELAQFLTDLDTREFELDLRAFELTVPLDLTVGLDRVEPAGALVVAVTRNQVSRGSVKFTLGKGETRGNATVYRVTPEGNGKLAYLAGDDLRAELPVKAGTQQLKLIWDTTGSNTFRFDRLGREPRLVKPTGSGESAPGVRLVLTSGSIPKLPVLIATK